MSSNPNSSDFHYKEYSLKQLDNWVHDALNCDDLSSQDIYDTIVKCVDESVEYHKKYLTKSVELLSLLKGHRPTVDFDYTDTSKKFPLVCDKDDKSPECQRSWNDFWEENYYPEEHQQYTEEELSAMCDKAASEAEKQKCREYNLREAEYYDKRAKLDAEYKNQTNVSSVKKVEHSEYYYDYTRNDEKREDPFKVKKWVLPIEETKIAETDEIDYFITFPDDLLEAANLKEGDQVEWVDKGDGSYLLKKVEKKAPTYDEMISEGWTMTADGFWIKEPLKMDEC